MMNQMNLELILMMQLFENEVKVHDDMLLHFHILVHVLMMQLLQMKCLNAQVPLEELLVVFVQ